MVFLFVTLCQQQTKLNLIQLNHPLEIQDPLDDEAFPTEESWFHCASRKSQQWTSYRLGQPVHPKASGVW